LARADQRPNAVGAGFLLWREDLPACGEGGLGGVPAGRGCAEELAETGDAPGQLLGGVPRAGTTAQALGDDIGEALIATAAEQVDHGREQEPAPPPIRVERPAMGSFVARRRQVGPA